MQVTPIQKATPEGKLTVNGNEVYIFDASGWTYCPGISNVTLDNVTQAAKSAGSRAHEVTTLKVKPTVYIDLRMSGQIHFQMDGKATFRGVLKLQVDDALPHDWTVYDSHLCSDAGEVLAVLRTREY